MENHLLRTGFQRGDDWSTKAKDGLAMKPLLMVMVLQETLKGMEIYDYDFMQPDGRFGAS